MNHGRIEGIEIKMNKKFIEFDIIHIVLFIIICFLLILSIALGIANYRYHLLVNNNLYKNTALTFIDVEKFPELRDDIYFGDQNSDLNITVFMDYQCPFCQQFYIDILKDIIFNEENISVSIVDIPIDTIHNNAYNLAVASECVHQLSPSKSIFFINQIIEDQYFKDVDMTYNAIENELLKLNDSDINLDSCKNNENVINAIEQDFHFSIDKVNISGTPTIYINGELYVGSMNTQDILQLLKLQ